MPSQVTLMGSFLRPGQRARLLLIMSGLIVAIGYLLNLTVPYAQGLPLLWETLLNYDPTNYQHIIVNLTYLPRLVVAVLCGFSLAVAGAVMQFVLRNPIASPTTLGVASGAELGMVLGILLLPASLAIPSFFPAFLGGSLATALVFLLSAKRGFAPVHMVLAGMVISLFFGSVNTMLLLLHEQTLSSVFVWGAGTLNQNGWDTVTTLLPMTLLPLAALMVLQRPLASLQLGDGVASSLGINVKQIKVLCLGLAIFMTASVVSEVGLIGFVGIVAPAIARMLGSRKLHQTILLSGVIGSLMLLLADLIIQPFSGVGGEMLPTGAMTALLGSPFLLWLLRRKTLQSELRARDESTVHYHQRDFNKTLLILSVFASLCLILAITVGQGQQGWSVTFTGAVWEYRFPRVAVALLAGIGLALAGTIIQRVTTNPMASPEVLGISSGAALALVIGALLGISVERHEQVMLGTAGALLVTAVIWLMGKKHQFAPTQTLLTGIALSAGLDAFLRIAMSSGQDNVRALLTWLSGSTYLVSAQDVTLLAIGVGGLLIVTLSLSRWIDLIGLGEVSATSVGLDCRRVRQLLLLLVAGLTTLCTIVIGPLSFVGLLAPHMARTLNQYTAQRQLIVACLLGGCLMMIADWIGRNLWFPWQFPAGLLASVIGGGYFLYLMRK